MPWRLPTLSKEELYDLYVVQKKSSREIAELFGVNKQTIHCLRWRYGIESIPRWSRNDLEITPRQHEVINGTLMGDGSISCGKKEACLSIKHAMSQQEYVLWKYEELKSLCKSEPKPAGGRLRFRTRHHPVFTSMRGFWYPNDRKSLTLDHLNLITPLGLAVWFLDDGTNISNGQRRPCGMLRFSTCSFSEKEHEIMIKWFRSRYEVETIMSNYGGYLVLRIEKDSRKRFLEIIRPHVPACMEYKIRCPNNW